MRWWRDPLRGLGWRDRRRLWKLSRSSRVIDKPEDRPRVEALIRYHRRFLDSRLWNVVTGLLWVAGSTFLVGAIVRLILGHIAHAVTDLLIASVSGIDLLLTRWVARALDRTAKVNGWA